MGTRSRIAVMHGEVCKSVYCHWDGYLEHNGAILQEHYDSAKANQLVAMGDLSSLRPEIGEKHAFSPFHVKNNELSKEENDRIEAELKASYEAAQEAGWCTFYGRDRDETDCTWSVDHSFEDFLARAKDCTAEFYYVMKDGEWYVGDTDGSTALSNRLTPLAEALQAVETV
jgi:hypothetical protein